MAKKKSNPAQSSFLDNNNKTAPAVPAIRAAVREWVAGDYQGATDTTHALLNYWFHTDHKLANGRPFSYHSAQREAIEALVYVFEIAKTHTMTDLFQRFIPKEQASQIRLPGTDNFARYCTKMATGSGKTKVMSLAIAWQYFNAVIENDPVYAKYFIIFAPNVIVFDRLRSDFVGGRMFKEDPIIPKELQIFWDMQFYMRGEAERASSTGALYLTNIQQVTASRAQEDDEPDIMTQVLGKKPPANLNEVENFRERLLKRTDSKIMVINDEAHHTHDEDSAWSQAIDALNTRHPLGIAAQLDFSATPRHQSGALFAWTISDYTLKQAILDGIVKRPIKGITDLTEENSSIASIRYQGFLIAGVERWREYREALSPLNKKPLLFLMMKNTAEADDVAHHLQAKYPTEFGGDKTLILHVDQQGDISKDDLDKARKAAAQVDSGESPVNAVVSVLMLREGWDVQNVTVVVGLRPYNSKAKILPEQAIGRGLRLMFRDLHTPYRERVDIIGSPGFIQFVEQLEQEEDIQFDTWEVGKEKLTITTIEPVADKASFDVSLPVLSPILVRASSIAQEIEALDVTAIKLFSPLPRKRGSREERTFRYDGVDFLTLEKLIERKYAITSPQTSGEIIMYYAQAVASELKLPGHFHLIAPKVRDFLKLVAFGTPVDLDSAEIIEAINSPLVRKVTLNEFLKLLRPMLVSEQKPVLESPGRTLGTLDPFPWARHSPMAAKIIFNKVPCDNQFEEDFARFLDRAFDVARFGKLPMHFGFNIPYTDAAGNLRLYYPDFVVVDTNGVNYVVETKGREDIDVRNKDRSAVIWAQNATQLTGQQWRYVKVMQKDFEDFQPSEFGDFVHLYGQMELPFDD